MKNKEKKDKKSFIELWKDKRERAKIELILYGIFFLGVIIFARVLGSNTKNIDKGNQIPTSFVSTINDNYEYDIVVTIDDNTYYYYGKVLGNNKSINLKIDDELNSYYLMNKKYYILENNNYILTDEEEVYPYIDYRYLNINNIKEYMNIAIKEDDTYSIKLSDLILNSDSTDYLTININEGDKNIVIDYTPLLKLSGEDISKAIVNITYNNINNVISLEE